MTKEEKTELIKQEIEDLYECLRLMPEDSVLGKLSVKATIRSKKRKLEKLLRGGRNE